VTESNEPNNKTPPEDTQNTKLTSKKRFVKVLGIVDIIFNRFIPDFAPRLNIDEKLIENEHSKDYALIRYYSELQILLGVIVFSVGAIGAISSHSVYLLVCILGAILIVTGFDIEEIYVTNIRLLIRRIGLLERVIRIPSDEEHLLKHVVSFNIGRAPVHKVLMALAGIGFFAGLTLSIASFTGLIVLLASTALFILGLRIGKRIVTLNLAGGHYVILGLRKGVPTHLIQSLMTSTFTE
jgi:hypothetical protein